MPRRLAIGSIPLRAGALLLALSVASVAWSPAPARRPRPVSDAPPVVSVSPAPGQSRFEGDFEARLRAAPSHHHFQALVDLSQQVDLPRLGARLRQEGRDKAARRQAVVGALERVAAAQQSLLHPVLDRMLAEGSLTYVQPVAIVNRLVVEGTAAGILALAEHPEVARVLPEWSSARTAGRADPVGPAAPPDALGERFRSWAVEATGASRLWAQGLDGRGVVVAALDTGADATHEQLRGRRLEGSRGWFDPVEGAAAPYDPHGHGTGVLSQAVGGGVGDRVVGLAPGASWAAGLANWHNQYSRVRMTVAADWALRVARPDVLVNAWSHDEGACQTFDLPFVNAWKAAEIFVVFPAGNAGPGPGTGESPSQLSGTYPDGGPVFSVGALDPSGEVFRESSRGPSACGTHPFPSMSAPGARLPFAFPSRERAYGTGDGTSLAAGVVGGAAALLLQAAPELGPADVEAALLLGARDVPPQGWDPAAGAGALDLSAALDRARFRAREIEASLRRVEGKRGRTR